ncbi:MAG: lipocalin family protein, partial [Methylophilaceae bacterium]
MGAPDNVKIVEGVDAKQYIGTWYEIARLDHSFE